MAEDQRHAAEAHRLVTFNCWGTGGSSESTAVWQAAAGALAACLPHDAVYHLAHVYEFAVDRHGEQRRPGGEPYVQHLAETLEIVFASGVSDPAVLSAALLHDVVEDTATKLSEVRARFGAPVAALVACLTAPESPPADAALARRSYLARFAIMPVDVLAVKLADRYSNVQRLHTHPRADRRRSYYAETVEYFVPLASRLPFYDRLFAAWAAAYGYLADQPAAPTAGATSSPADRDDAQERA